jgi:hypothetical protein
LRFDFEDNFGLDHQDLNTIAIESVPVVGIPINVPIGDIPAAGEGFRAWYILQHYNIWNGCFRPFHTKVTLYYDLATRKFI